MKQMYMYPHSATTINAELFKHLNNKRAVTLYFRLAFDLWLGQCLAMVSVLTLIIHKISNRQWKCKPDWGILESILSWKSKAEISPPCAPVHRQMLNNLVFTDLHKQLLGASICICAYSCILVLIDMIKAYEIACIQLIPQPHSYGPYLSGTFFMRILLTVSNTSVK